MIEPPAGNAEPFAAGREADVFVLDDRRVLRRYRRDADTTGEAAVMRYVGGFGFPVPEVFAVRGPEMVMERLDGPTMAQAALAGQLSLAECATILADLHLRLHALPARSERSTRSHTIVHLDLHPENVLMTARGPVVIDWPNAGDGPADLDTALTALMLAQVSIGAIQHELHASAGELLDRFLALAPGDPTRLLDEAVTIKAGQHTLTADEVEMLGSAASRVLNPIT